MEYRTEVEPIQENQRVSYELYVRVTWEVENENLVEWDALEKIENWEYEITGIHTKTEE